MVAADFPSPRAVYRPTDGRRPILPSKGRRVPPILVKPPFPERKRYMTLVAGFVCKDGFTIVSDTEETSGVRSQTSKLDGLEAGPFELSSCDLRKSEIFSA